VLLKHPGGVPCGAGVGDCPPWQSAQTGALSGFVSVWVMAPSLQGVLGWGALTSWQVKQDTAEIPPEKSAPWQGWQDENPFICDIIETPCDAAADHPAGWPVFGSYVDSWFACPHPARSEAPPYKTSMTIVCLTRFFIIVRPPLLFMGITRTGR